MRPDEPITVVIVGGIFIVLGILSIIWGFREESTYYEEVSHRMDLREFLERWPPRIQPWAVKVGGIIAIAVGLGLIAWGAYFWLRA